MKKLSRCLNYLILTVVVLFGALYFYDASLTSTTRLEKAPVDVDKLVNKFLKQTSEQALKEELAFKEALQKQMQKTIEIKKDVVDIKSEDIPVSQQIWKDDLASRTPSEDIQAQRYQQDLAVKQKEHDKKEYARQFIENARNSGFHVVLSSDFKVLSVTPLRKPSQNEDAAELFPAN